MPPSRGGGSRQLRKDFALGDRRARADIFESVGVPPDPGDEPVPKRAHKETSEATFDEEQYRNHLEELWIKNKLNSRDTQGVASSSTKAGAGGVMEFAKAGNTGKNQKNIKRGLL